MNRKTATILVAASGLVAAAVILEQQNRPAGAARRPDVSPTPPDPVVPEPGRPTPPALACSASTTPASGKIDTAAGTFTAALSQGKILQAAGGEVYVSFDLQAREAPVGERRPLNLAIVIDRSGSMAGAPIQKAREAAKGIVSRLADTDSVAVVQYDDTANVVMASTRADREGKARLSAAIDGIRDAGGTNLHDGLALGRDEVMKDLAGGRINRVILLSDGRANVGISDTPTLARVAGAAADKGIAVTAIGVGIDYNEDLMEALAENGRGNYYFVKDAGSLESVFAGELKALQATVATSAELRIDPSCAGVEIVDVYGYTFRREGTGVVVPLADLAGGDRRKVLVKLRAPAGAIGRTDVVAARFDFKDAVAGERKSASLALGVEITSDGAAATASVDREVMAKVTEVEAARAMRAATEAYDRGDVNAARGILGDARMKTKDRAKAYNLGPASIAPIEAELGMAGDAFDSHAPGSAAGKAAVKGRKAAAREMAQ